VNALKVRGFNRGPKAGAALLAPRYNSALSKTKRADQGMDRIKIMSAQERELAELIVTTLNLDLSAEEVDPDAALYREGLGLDSIDILEIALAVSKTYGFQLRSDDSDNIKIFSSLRSLNEHVQRSRTK
jgi:acyl carrier protein